MMVTYLELLEMMKNKTQPEKIIYDNCEYEWGNAFHEYFREGKEGEPYEFYALFGDISREFNPFELITEKIIEIIG